jgi:hypothetical protein
LDPSKRFPRHTRRLVLNPECETLATHPLRGAGVPLKKPHFHKRCCALAVYPRTMAAQGSKAPRDLHTNGGPGSIENVPQSQLTNRLIRTFRTSPNPSIVASMDEPP